jgi:hypothetical protein
MSDLKITQLTAATSVVGADLLPVVTDVGSSPANKKITLTNLIASLEDLLDSPTCTNLLIDGDDGSGFLVLKRTAITNYKLIVWKTGSADDWCLGTRSFSPDISDLTLYGFSLGKEIFKAHVDHLQMDFLDDTWEMIRDLSSGQGVTRMNMKNALEGQYGETFISMQTTGSHMLVGVTVPGCEYPDPGDGAWDGDGYLWLTGEHTLRIGVDNYEILRVGKNHNVGIGLGTQDGGDGGTGTTWCLAYDPPEKFYVDQLATEKIGFGSYTDDSNYEYGLLYFDTDKVVLSAKTAGTGSDDISIEMVPIGTGKLRLYSQKASSGTRYLIIDSSGYITSSASAPSGT